MSSDSFDDVDDHVRATHIELGAFDDSVVAAVDRDAPPQPESPASQAPAHIPPAAPAYTPPAVAPEPVPAPAPAPAPAPVIEKPAPAPVIEAPVTTIPVSP
ncbi:MAG: hypothetical protein QOE41_3455 [Mycobacterium sp.]|nr:hypothetical protein [Mycobacterium sp.]